MNITIIYGTGNSLTRNFNDGATVSEVLTAARAALGFGANVEGHVDGVPVSGNLTLADGDTVSVHDKACSKAADMVTEIRANGGVTVKFTYGTGNSVTHTFPEGTTLSQALACPQVRAALGFGSNVEGHVEGIPMPAGTTLAPNEEVSVHDKACSKAGAITVTYGTGNSLTRTFPEGTTVQQALEAARAALGFGQNVEGHIDGVPVSGGTTLADGDTVEVHDKACSKATR